MLQPGTSAPHKNFLNLYEKMTGKGESASAAHDSFGLCCVRGATRQTEQRSLEELAEPSALEVIYVRSIHKRNQQSALVSSIFLCLACGVEASPAQSLQKNVGKDGRVENGMRSLKMKNTKASLYTIHCGPRLSLITC